MSRVADGVDSSSLRRTLRRSFREQVVVSIVSGPKINWELLVASARSVRSDAPCSVRSFLFLLVRPGAPSSVLAPTPPRAREKVLI